MRFCRRSEISIKSSSGNFKRRLCARLKPPAFTQGRRFDRAFFCSIPAARAQMWQVDF
jgi:hypothetical protein